MTVRSRYPAKAFWTALIIFTTLIRIPFLCLYFIPPTLRPHRNWSLRQAVFTKLLKIWFQYASAVEFKYPISLEQGAEKERFVQIPVPKAGELYRGYLNDEIIKPKTTGGTWFPHRYQPATDGRKKVILHLHGGAFVLSDSRDANCGTPAKILVKGTSALIFFLEYRLSTRADGRFPAALQDVVTAYQYLLDRDISASDIILSGDSAGANLAIAFLRYLTENEGLLPHPSAVLLWSPWVNMAAKRATLDQHPNQSTDYLPFDFLAWGSRVYIPAFMPKSHPYFSPLEHPFATPVPLWVQVSALEIFRDDGVQFYDRMHQIAGNRAALSETPDASHDVLLTAHLVGREDYVAQATQSARKFAGW